MASPARGVNPSNLRLPQGVSQMSWRFVRSSWQTVVALLLVRTLAFGFVLDPVEEISCLDGRRRCFDDTLCRGLLSTMERVCDDTMFTCTTPHMAQCHSVLLSLQESRHFQTCTCDPIRPDAVECIEQQKLIFLHACVTDDVTHPNITWIVPKPNALQERSEPKVLPPSFDYEEPEYSCIRNRKDCLVDLTCNEILKEYRETCKENKKQGMCVATEKQRCFNAIQDLRSTAPEIFECVCPMRSDQSLKRCLHIQSRLANNTCLVSVPYFIYSTRNQENTYNDLVSMVNDMPDTSDHDGESTCVQAFKDCNFDAHCRMRMASVMSSCSYDRSGNTCHRPDCLERIKSFYLLVRAERTHPLLFCRCRSGDKSCQTVRESLYPTCSVVEDPPPSCIDILDRCDRDSDCRERWESYEHDCRNDREKNGCEAGLAECRAAQLKIMGTILTTNCTCVHTDHATNEKCYEARRRLQHRNVCKEMAIRDFHRQPPTEPPKTLWRDGIVAAEQNDCQRSLSRKIPSYMTIPSVVRRYNNDSDCSEVCQCHPNGSFICRKLPCGKNNSCKDKSDVHAHGSSFLHDDRGQCRCIKAETVCAKATEKIVPKEGLFLHVGYSLHDQYLIEDNSGAKFEPDNISEKLGSLMNEDSAEQFCRLNLYDQFDGNLVFEITVSEYNPKSNKMICIQPSKMISYMINSRNPIILTDAMLSILKVSQLEQIQFHEPDKDEVGSKAESLGSSTCLILIFINSYIVTKQTLCS